MLSTDLYYLLVFAFLGAIWFNLDAACGAAVYGWWYSMTHKDKLPAAARRGFIYKRQAKTRFYTAMALASAEYLLFAHWMSFGPLAKLSVWIFGILATFAGFYLGPALHVIWRKKDVVLDKIDEAERGELNLAQQARETASNLRESVEEKVGGVAHQISEAVSDAVEEVRDHLTAKGEDKPTEAASGQPVEAAKPAISAAETLEQLMTETTGQAPAASQPKAAAPPQAEEDPAAVARRKLREFGGNG